VPSKTITPDQTGGLVRDGSVEGLREGGGYRIVGATGDVLEGVVHTHDTPSDFAGTVVGLNDGLVRFWAEMGTASIWIAPGVWTTPP